MHTNISHRHSDSVTQLYTVCTEDNFDAMNEEKDSEIELDTMPKMEASQAKERRETI